MPHQNKSKQETLHFVAIAYSDAYLEPSQASLMKPYAKVAENHQLFF